LNEKKEITRKGKTDASAQLRCGTGQGQIVLREVEDDAVYFGTHVPPKTGLVAPADGSEFTSLQQHQQAHTRNLNFADNWTSLGCAICLACPQMINLFNACHSYPKTWDGTYFKRLREGSGHSPKTLSSLSLGTKCPIDEEGIESLESGTFETWFEDLALKLIAFLQPLVLQSNGVSVLPEPPSDATAKQLRKQCKLLGFKLAKYRRSAGGWRYRIIHLASGLHFSSNDFGVIVASVEAAMKEHSAQKTSEPTQEKQVQVFDPFDL
jgi:hypothetical protein